MAQPLRSTCENTATWNARVRMCYRNARFASFVVGWSTVYEAWLLIRWVAGRDPYFITRDAASITPCIVRSGAPYLDPDDPKCEPCALETHGKKLGVDTFDRKSKKGKNVVLVAPLPKGSSCIEGIDPGITALLAIPESDDLDLTDIILPQFPAIADTEEVFGGDVTAKASPGIASLPHVLTHNQR